MSVIGLLTLSVCIYSCTKENVNNSQPKIVHKAIQNSPIYQARWGFGWTTFGLSDHCQFCPFWACKGGWDSPWGIDPVDDNTPEEVSRIYVENGKFVTEMYADNNNLPIVLSNITNGKIHFQAPDNGEQFITIPSIVVTTLQLNYDKIYPGDYSATVVPNTNRVKITFN